MADAAAIANLGLTAGVASDLVITQSDVKVVLSDVAAVKSDLVVLQASEDSDMVILKSDIAAVKSDLVAIQGQITNDVISDLTAISDKITNDVISDLIALQAAEDSDMVVLKAQATSDMVVLRADNTKIVSDIAVADSVVDAIKLKTDLIPAAPASTTNITAGTITTVTNLTNAPTSGDLTATMKTSVTTACTSSLNSYDPPTKAECDAAGAPAKGAATTAGTIVQDNTSGTPDIVTVTTNASANTFGSWTQIDASAAADVWISHITFNGLGTSAISFCLEIGTGASPAAKARFSFYVDYTVVSSVGYNYVPPIIFALPIPIKVASGTAISARVSSSAAGTFGGRVGVSYYAGLETS